MNASHPTLRANDIIRNARASWRLLEVPVHNGEYAFGGQRAYKAAAVVSFNGRSEVVTVMLPEKQKAA